MERGANQGARSDERLPRGRSAAPVIGERSVARQRAAALRERRFPCEVIARWLDAEGYAAPNTDPGHWTRSDVLKLPREARGVQPPTLPDEPPGAPAALL